MYKVYGDCISGNCYKVKLLLNQLQTEHEWIYTDLLNGACRTEEFLAINPNGKAPVLEISAGQYLSESNAILCYLAENTDFSLQDHYNKSQILQWLFFEQYSHEPYIAVSRFIKLFSNKPDAEKTALLKEKYKPGVKALTVMENHLNDKTFFVEDRYTIADIALYAYTHTAEESGFTLNDFPNIQDWIKRVQDKPNHITMQAACKLQTL